MTVSVTVRNETVRMTMIIGLVVCGARVGVRGGIFEKKISAEIQE